MKIHKRFLSILLFFLSLTPFAVLADCGGADTELTQKALNVLAMEWRDMHSSSNRGNCWTQLLGTWGDPFIFKHQANAKESEEIEEHKKVFKLLQKDMRGDSGHDIIMAYADYLDDYAKLNTVESATSGSSWTKTRAGNCGEISATLYKYILQKYKGLDLAAVRVPGGDHQFVLVRTDCGIFIVDGWLDEGQAVGPVTISGGSLLDDSGNPPEGYDTQIQLITGSTDSNGAPQDWQPSTGSNSLY